MIIIECEQGSEEWHKARAGVITASMFDVACDMVDLLTDQQQKYVDAIVSGSHEKEAMEIAGYKAKPSSSGIKKALAGEQVGDHSDAAKNYAFRLAVERISGTPLDEGFSTWQMKRGNELEPLARMEHAMQSGLMIDRCGFVLTEDRAFGASADGLIGTKGGSEYKCFLAPEKLRAFHLENDASSIKGQVQGCLWVTGREWWHAGLFCPALEVVGKQLWWRQIDRDEAYIEKREGDLLRFKKLVDQYEAKLRA